MYLFAYLFVYLFVCNLFNVDFSIWDHRTSNRRMDGDGKCRRVTEGNFPPIFLQYVRKPHNVLK